jgi:transposase-like protein
VKAGLEKDKAALLVAIAGLSDGQKVVLAVEPGYRESTESWSAVLRDLKRRGVNSPRLVVGDGHLGIWGALSNIFPAAEEQRCWNHKIVNVLDKLPRKAQVEAKGRLQKIAYSQSLREAEENRDQFLKGCQKGDYPRAAATLGRDWDRMVTFYNFPKEHWKHLRTTNPVESHFAGLRQRTDAAKRYKKVDNATAVIWKLLLLAEQRLRMKEVFLGVQFRDGIEVKVEDQVAAA